MHRRSLLVVAALLVSVSTHAESARPETPLAARHGYATRLLRHENGGERPDFPPSGELELVLYPAPLGKNAAYVSADPKDGKKHPAIIWLVGGFSNSISDIAWTPGPKSNDQSALGFRRKGVLMMYPSLRGGNDNPGSIETFFGEVDDVLAAAKYLATRDYVDPARIYIGGHSTGGTLALLVAASAEPKQFRAAFSLGPVNDVAGYGADVLPFDVNDAREVNLRAPERFLGSIYCPTFIFEGTKSPSNISALRALQRGSKNPLLHFHPVSGGTHFNIIAPLADELAASILADGPNATSFTYAHTDPK
jgi:pimeloyl-ACP methyl ester carboxylesterase